MNNQVRPSGWQSALFSELAAPVTDKYIPRKHGIGFKCVNLENLPEGTGRIAGFSDAAENLSIKTVFEPKDVLFGKLRPYLRKYARADFSGVCTTEILVFRATQAVEPGFLFQVVASDAFIEHNVAVSYGTKMPRTDWRTAGTFPVPLPPLAEQRRIAEILLMLDEQIEQTEALIQKQSTFKLGLMKQLLEPGDDWSDPIALGSLVIKGGGSIQTGPFGSQLHERDYVSDGTPIITVEHILAGEVRGEDAPKVGRKDVQRLSRYLLRESDIVFSRVGAIDRSAHVDAVHDGWLFSGRLLRVRPGASANSKFLAYLLGYDKQQRWIYNHSVGSTMLCLNTSILASVPIRLPNKLYQEHAVELLNSVIAELNMAQVALKQARLSLSEDLCATC